MYNNILTHAAITTVKYLNKLGLKQTYTEFSRYSTGSKILRVSLKPGFIH